MRETPITITGNVVTAPSRRKTEAGHSVTSFRIASTERRFVKATGAWADGNSLFLSVTCWRDLADNVERCVVKGDPVVVTGHIYTREYELDGQRRASFEVTAEAVGLNLAKGTCAFTRTRSGPPTFEVTEPAGSPAGDGEYRTPAGDEGYETPFGAEDPLSAQLVTV
jgi:single-strand DNA-binding protein